MRARLSRSRRIAFRATFESLEQRRVLNGELDAAYAGDIAGLVQGGLYNWETSPPWADVITWGGDWAELRPFVGMDGDDSGIYEAGGFTYHWTVSYHSTVTSSGSPGGDSSGRTDWSEDISVTATSIIYGSGGDGTTQTEVHQTSSTTVTWHDAGDTGWSSHSFDKVVSDTYSTIVTGGDDPADRHEYSGSTTYHYTASGGETGGTPYGSYTLNGEVKGKVAVTDKGGSGGMSHFMDATENTKYVVDNAGSLAPGGSSTFDETHCGDSSFLALVWGAGGGSGNEGSADPNDPNTTVGDDNARLTSYYTDHHSLRRWGSSGPSGYAINYDLTAGGTDGYNLEAIP